MKVLAEVGADLIPAHSLAHGGADLPYDRPEVVIELDSIGPPVGPSEAAQHGVRDEAEHFVEHVTVMVGEGSRESRAEGSHESREKLVEDRIGCRLRLGVRGQARLRFEDAGDEERRVMRWRWRRRRRDVGMDVPEEECCRRAYRGERSWNPSGKTGEGEEGSHGGRRRGVAAADGGGGSGNLVREARTKTLRRRGEPRLDLHRGSTDPTDVSACCP